MLSNVVAGLQNVSWKLQMVRKQGKLSLVISEALIHHELVGSHVVTSADVPDQWGASGGYPLEVTSISCLG